MSYRTRDQVELEIETAFGDRISVSAYMGMLPEDMLGELLKQQLSRLYKGVSDWVGPNEKVQELLTGTLSSAKRGV